MKCEGLYFLRYRVFDLFNGSASQDPIPMQNECYGHPFRVYSTKDFPGLASSSELTRVRNFKWSGERLLTQFVLQHLSKSGVRLTIRAADRKRRKKAGSDSDDD